jgi:hypothetical protein
MNKLTRKLRLPFAICSLVIVSLAIYAPTALGQQTASTDAATPLAAQPEPIALTAELVAAVDTTGGRLTASPSELASSSEPSLSIDLSDLPESPEPQQVASAIGTTTPPVHEDKQPKRILGIFPNFRAVSTSDHLPPQSVHEKFVTASQDSFDYSSFVLPALLAAEQLAENDTPEFHSGAVAYGRYYWHSLVDQDSENYFVEFIVPTIMSEDTRYYTLGKQGGGTAKRLGYALSRAVITRSDFGGSTFNAGEIVGALASAALSNVYYPTPERTVGNTISKFGVDVGVDAATFAVREFWPDINHFLFHGHAGETPTAP